MVAFGLVETEKQILLGLAGSEDRAPALARLGGNEGGHLGLQAFRLQGSDDEIALEAVIERVRRMLQRAAAAGAVDTIGPEMPTVRLDALG
ncbi:hypothetical protein D9M68_348150 [compost metagenome]